ncbi:helix-turn-helix transcriptional regulator [Deinococcus navajonensis]|uniref:Helix-turn-helix transcriptional regulator n=1 Tax=Deinococcus navajonensis TaxID=309884 RepID=A0ABV8XSY2_9DEIO
MTLRPVTMTAPVALPERTKTRVLDLIKRHGPQTAQDLAARLDVSIPAARRHLGDLLEQGLLEARIEKPGGRGRPQHVFALTERGEAAFPNTSSGLCVDVLRHLRELFGQGAVLQVLDARNQALGEQLSVELEEAATLGERVERLAVQLTALGFEATSHRETSLHEDGASSEVWVLTQTHCPHLPVARQYQELCASELTLYRDLLGVAVTRDSRIACGQGCCRYRIAAAPHP